MKQKSSHNFSEFDIINRYFASQTGDRQDVIIGIGDDAAVLKVPPDQQLVVSIDSIVSGIHFPDAAKPQAIGHKALAVSLSDLAAMGADPAWVTLALTMPEVDEAWLDGFCEGFFPLMKKFSLQLVGGNISRGPLSVTTELHGFVPDGGAIKRSDASLGDLIYVTGTLGNAALGLCCLQGKINIPSEKSKTAIEHFYYPKPRIKEGLLLRGLATAAIDISDGLLMDIEHLVQQSYVAAMVCLDDIPLPQGLEEVVNLHVMQQLALSGGEDYELCFTVPNQRQSEVELLFSTVECGVTCIGSIEIGSGLQLKHRDGKFVPIKNKGYQHFCK